MNIEFTDKHSGFKAKDAGNTSYIYMPIASGNGVMSNITPDGHGDLRLSQDRYFLPPVVVEDLQESMVSRNFWVKPENSYVPAQSCFGFLCLSLPRVPRLMSNAE